MWDKAIFVWILGGLALATVVIFPKEFRLALTSRNLAIAACGAALGALPLIVYNVRNDCATFRENTVLSSAGIGQKAEALRRTLDGSGLFGYLVNDDWVEPHKNPSTRLEGTLVGLQDRVGKVRANLIPWALVVSAAAFPLWRRRWRAMLFPLIASVAAWLQMAFTKDAGGSVHHAALLYPLPVWMIAVAAAGLADGPRWRKWLTGAAIALLCCASLRVTNQYFTQFVRYGAAPVWSDANTRLMYTPLPPVDILIMDWGVMNSLEMFHRGQLRIWNGVDPVAHDAQTENDRAMIRHMLELPSPVFIGHTPQYEVNRGASERLERTAAKMGYARQVLQTVSDSNGRTVFEIYRFAYNR